MCVGAEEGGGDEEWELRMGGETGREWGWWMM
jgi:hypothetical protein